MRIYQDTISFGKRYFICTRTCTKYAYGFEMCKWGGMPTWGIRENVRRPKSHIECGILKYVGTAPIQRVVVEAVLAGIKK